MQRPGAPRRDVPRSRLRDRGRIAAALAAATAVPFLPVLGNGFVDWDDTRNFLMNPSYRGLGWAQLRWMASEPHHGHFVPLTWLTHGLDYVLWGMNPAGYHLTSLGIHVGTTLALYALARTLIGRAVPVGRPAATAGGAVAALLFGLHPLRVESVAWATERRDVLSGLFFLLTVLAYVKATAAAGPRRRWLLGASLAAHVAALLSKSITVTAPLVLLLLDIYPLRRLSGPPWRWGTGPAARVLLEKAPYAVLSAAQALLTYQFFRTDLVHTGTTASWQDSLARVLLSLWFYPLKTLVPVDLSPLYEAPATLALADPWVVRAAAGVGLVSLLAWLLRHRCPGLATAWASYAILLAPVSGIVSLGHHVTADRYSYLACVGFVVLAGGGVAVLVDVPARRRLALATLAAAGVAALVLGALTWRQTLIWRDTGNLWRHAARVTPGCSICQLNLGHELLDAGAPEVALGHFRTALSLQPDRLDTYRSLGRTLEALGRPQAALEAYREGLTRSPASLDLRLALAAALVRADRHHEAIEVVDGAWRFYEPRGLARYFEEAARHGPEAPVPRLGLVRAWLTLGEPDRARRELEVLRRLQPDLATVVATGRAS